MSIDLTGTLTIFNIVFMILVVVGGYIAMRYGIARTTSEIQDRVRDALKDENELLQGRVQRLEAENKRLNDLMGLIIKIFDQRGITVEIRDTLVEVRDKQSGTFTSGSTLHQSP